MAFSEIQTIKVADPVSRVLALKVIAAVYLEEKNWIFNPENEIPTTIGQSTKYSWFLALVNRQPVGVIRLTYDPSLEFPAELGVTLKDGVNLAAMAKECKIADIGRFMIIPEHRKNIRVVLRLMRSAINEVVKRDYTHFITDVFETDPNSPLHFHTKILGFEIIGSHLHGELNCSSTRIILTLDILKSYQRLREKKNKIYQEVTEGIRDILDQKLVKKQGLPG